MPDGSRWNYDPRCCLDPSKPGQQGGYWCSDDPDPYAARWFPAPFNYLQPESVERWWGDSARITQREAAP